MIDRLLSGGSITYSSAFLPTPFSESARCMVLIISPRMPMSRSLVSASRATFQSPAPSQAPVQGFRDIEAVPPSAGEQGDLPGRFAPA